MHNRLRLHQLHCTAACSDGPGQTRPGWARCSLDHSANWPRSPTVTKFSCCRENARRCVSTLEMFKVHRKGTTVWHLLGRQAYEKAFNFATISLFLISQMVKPPFVKSISEIGPTSSTKNWLRHFANAFPVFTGIQSATFDIIFNLSCPRVTLVSAKSNIQLYSP